MADEARVSLTGSLQPTFATFDYPRGGITSARCPVCGGIAKRRACPDCHTTLPIEFVESYCPIIAFTGSKGSGKTVLMTVLVSELRRIIGRRYGAEIRIASEHPDGFESVRGYRANREASLLQQNLLPAMTMRAASRAGTPSIVLRWRQEMSQRTGNTPKSTFLALLDVSGEDLTDLETISTLRGLAACDLLVVTIDPFTLPGARAKREIPYSAVYVHEEAHFDIIGNITEWLRINQDIRSKRKILTPVAVILTKMDAFLPILVRSNPITSTARAVAGYDDADGLAVHESVRALLAEWNASALDRHMRLNYANYRYFAVSALGEEPDYEKAVLAGEVHPHRIEDPLLWLLSKEGTVPLAQR